jgi:hypothetical protein
MGEFLRNLSRIGLQIGGNCLDGAGGDALFTDDAARSRKVEPKGLGIEAQRLGGANPSAKPTVHADIFIDRNFPTGEGNGDIVRSHPVQCCVQLVNVARKLHHQRPNLVGGNLCPNNAGCYVEVFRKSISDGRVDIAFGEGEGDPFFHGGERRADCAFILIDKSD